MNKSVYQSRVSGLTAIAKKVFSVVPIAEAWPAHQIIGELKRMTDSAADPRIVSGCLNTLINQGLVTEPKPNTFRRVAVKESKLTELIAKKPNHKEVSPVATQKQQQSVSAIEKLAGIASRLKQVASDIESAAIEIDEQLKNDKQDTEKLKQLQSLLRSLG